jgi:hypothetical protein
MQQFVEQMLLNVVGEDATKPGSKPKPDISCLALSLRFQSVAGVCPLFRLDGVEHQD